MFVGAPASTLTKKQVKKYYEDAGKKVDQMIQKYRVHALREMHAAPETIEKEIAAVVPNKKAYEEAKEAENVADFLAKVQANESDEHLQKLIDDFVSTHDISFENLSNNARTKLQPMLQEAFKTIAQSVDEAGAVIYVKGYSDGKWKTVKQLTPEEFEAWMTHLLVRKEGGFIIDYQDKKHYDLTDGDNKDGEQGYGLSEERVEYYAKIHDQAKKAAGPYPNVNEDKEKWTPEEKRLVDEWQARVTAEEDRLDVRRQKNTVESIEGVVRKVGKYQHPSYIFERLHLDIATGQHKDGGNFCKYYYTGSDIKIKQWIREHYQIADHVPTKADKDLMVPCVIHAILRGVETYQHKQLTERQQTMLKDYLYTRLKTRYTNAATLAVIAEEIGMQIEICGLDGTPLHKYTVHGNKYSQYNPKARFGWDHWDTDHNRKKEGKLFGITDKTITSQHYKYIVRLVLWDDHFFVNEETEFADMRSYDLVRDLYTSGQLRPLNQLQRNIYSTQLLEYKVEQISWEQSMFMTPQQVYNNMLHPTQPYKGFDDSIMDITRGNIAEYILGV